MKLTMIKLPRYRVFNMIPRYYDQDKEELEERIRSIKEELNVEDDRNEEGVSGRMDFRGQFAKRRIGDVHTYSSTELRRSNIRLLVVLAVLFLLTGGGIVWIMKMAESI